MLEFLLVLGGVWELRARRLGLHKRGSVPLGFLNPSGRKDFGFSSGLLAGGARFARTWRSWSGSGSASSGGGDVA